MKETKEGNVTARENERKRKNEIRTKGETKKIIIIKEERHVRRKKGGGTFTQFRESVAKGWLSCH